jgi:hypothetical protein
MNSEKFFEVYQHKPWPDICIAIEITVSGCGMKYKPHSVFEIWIVFLGTNENGIK